MITKLGTIMLMKLAENRVQGAQGVGGRVGGGVNGVRGVVSRKPAAAPSGARAVQAAKPVQGRRPGPEEEADMETFRDLMM